MRKTCSALGFCSLLPPSSVHCSPSNTHIGASFLLHAGLAGATLITSSGLPSATAAHVSYNYMYTRGLWIRLGGAVAKLWRVCPEFRSNLSSLQVGRGFS